MTKQAKKAESTGDIAAETINMIVRSLRSVVQTLITELPTDESIARRVHIAQKLNAIVTEQRKAEAEARRSSSKVAKSDVLAFIRALDVSERSKLIKELIAIDQKGSVLSS